MAGHKSIYAAAGVLFFAAVLIMMGIFSIHASASGGSRSSKQVAMIEVQKGDTLWSIAKLYYTDEYKSLSRYINEIKWSNNLEKDTIHDGQHLIIPFYE